MSGDESLQPHEGTPIELFIPVRNGSDYLSHCVGSIQAQTFQDWHLTVLDNCSTDATQAIAEHLSSKDPRISYRRNAHDLGAIGNFNQCLDLVSAEFYTILSHDDFLRSATALESARRAMEEFPEVAVVYSDVEWVDASGFRIAEKRMPFRGKVARLEPAWRSLVEGRNHFGVPVLVRSNRVRGLRYDEAFPLTCDIDFSIAVSMGAAAYFMPWPAVAIRFHAGNGTMRQVRGSGLEFQAMARKYALELGMADRWQSRVHYALNTLTKRAFFFYLDHLRPPRNV